MNRQSIQTRQRKKLELDKDSFLCWEISNKHNKDVKYIVCTLSQSDRCQGEKKSNIRGTGNICAGMGYNTK